jgi:hypothetical protein
MCYLLLNDLRSGMGISRSHFHIEQTQDIYINKRTNEYNTIVNQHVFVFSFVFVRARVTHGGGYVFAGSLAELGSTIRTPPLIY